MSTREVGSVFEGPANGKRAQHTAACAHARVGYAKGERLCYADRFEDPNLPGEMRITVSLQEVSVGTEVNIVQEGIPDVIPPDACYLGWQESLEMLAKLVEADIPD